MGIFSQLRKCKPPDVFKDLNRYLGLYTKLAETNCTIDFYKECIQNNSFPRVFYKQLRRNHIKTDFTMLKRHASNIIDTLKSHATEQSRFLHARNMLIRDLSNDERQLFTKYMEDVADKRVAKKNNSLQRSLSNTGESSLFPDHPERYVHNFSDVELDNVLMEVFSLGPKFCCHRSIVDQIQIESQFENFYNQTIGLTASSDFDINQFKSDLVNCSYHYASMNNKEKSPLTRKHLDALKALRSRRDILLTKPDKGSGIVLLNKTEYLEKMSMILSDCSKFRMEPGGKDKTKAIEAQLTECLKRMKADGVISDSLFKQLKPADTITPRLYGLPKIHKSGIPMRPILDMCNSPYHALAKWLVEILEPVRRRLCRYSLRDTFEFVNQVKELNLESECMFSFDVTSLFTNVPLIETIDFICSQISYLNIDVPIPICSLKELLLRCTFNIQFRFNDSLYRQTDGVAMGSPLGPILSDLFMASLETGPLYESISSLSFYRRYVDDIFIIMDETLSITHLLDIFNQAHPSIQFTSEFEVNNSLPFLDVLLFKRPDGSLSRTVYRKQT